MKNELSLLQRLGSELSMLIYKHKKFFISVFFIYTITFCIVLPTLCMDIPYTMFVRSSTSNTDLNARMVSHVQALNKKRSENARKNFENLESNITSDYFTSLNNQSVDILVCVVTIRRAMDGIQLDYLTQTIINLDNQVRGGKSNMKTTMFICNTHAGPGEHDEAILLSKHFPMMKRFDKPDPEQVIKSRHEKQKDDYVYCLKQALKYKSKFIMMLEDDVIPVDNIMMTLDRILTRVENRPHWNPFVFLKLYYPERWQGYSFEMSRLFELLGVFILGGYLYYGLFRITEIRTYTNLSISLAICLGGVYSIAAALLIGRQNLMGWRRVSPETYQIRAAHDCCSPAVIYPTTMVEGMAQYLESIKCTIEYPVDIAMDYYANINNYFRYLVEPNLFYHIGMFSSLSAAIKNPDDFLKFD